MLIYKNLAFLYTDTLTDISNFYVFFMEVYLTKFEFSLY